MASDLMATNMAWSRLLSGSGQTQSHHLPGLSRSVPLSWYSLGCAHLKKKMAYFKMGTISKIGLPPIVPKDTEICSSQRICSTLLISADTLHG